MELVVWFYWVDWLQHSSKGKFWRMSTALALLQFAVLLDFVHGEFFSVTVVVLDLAEFFNGIVLYNTTFMVATIEIFVYDSTIWIEWSCWLWHW